MPSWQEFEKAVFGKASTAESGHQAPPPVQTPSTFRVSLNWIKEAIGLQSGSPPQALNTGQIIAALDAFQGGWPFAVFEGIEADVAGAQAGGFTLILTPADTFQRVILAMAVRNTTATPIAGVFMIASPGSIGNLFPPIPLPPQSPGGPVVGVSNPTPLICQFTVAPGGSVTTVDLIGARQLVIPPGYNFEVGILTGFGAGNVITDVAWARIPGGYRV